MTSPGILTWMLPLIGIRSAFAHHEIMEMIELSRALINSYRMACSTSGSSLQCLRVTIAFMKAMTAGGLV